MALRTVAVCCGMMLVRSLASAEPGDDLWAGLLANPPTAPMTAEREAAVVALDRWIMRPDSDEMPEVIAYYQRSIKRVLDLVENEPVTEGVRVFQLYSSSMLFQTPDVIFAIDLDQGPNKDLTMSPEEEGVEFRLTDEQVVRLASLVDLSFHTHQHEDHLDHELTSALLAAGKTVIVTPETIEMWQDQPWAEGLTALDQTIEEPHELAGLSVDLLRDRQWANNLHTAGTVCNAYIITTPDGVSVCAKGDINCGLRFYGWLQMMVARERHVDLMVGGPSYWRGVNCAREIDALLSPLWAPGHSWEFTHRKEGEPRGSCQTFNGMYRWIKPKAEVGETVMLTWGEYIDLPVSAGVGEQ